MGRTLIDTMAIPPWAMKVMMALPEDIQQIVVNPRALCVSTLPVALALAYTPHFAKYPSASPLVQRLAAAHINSLESFAAFAAAVISALVLKAKPLKIVKPAFIYLLLRIVYLITYAAGVNAPVALCRSVAWIMGQVQVFRIFNIGLIQ